MLCYDISNFFQSMTKSTRTFNLRLYQNNVLDIGLFAHRGKSIVSLSLDKYVMAIGLLALKTE